MKIRTFEFTYKIVGKGETCEEALDDAMDALGLPDLASMISPVAVEVIEEIEEGGE